MRFIGLEPWPEGGSEYEVIECFRDGVTYDLHNWSWFQGFRWESTSRVFSLTFAFQQPDLETLHASKHRATTELTLHFFEVRGLTIGMDDEFVPQQAEDVEGWNWFEAGGRGSVAFGAGTFEFAFTCAEVELRVSQRTNPASM